MTLREKYSFRATAIIILFLAMILAVSTSCEDNFEELPPIEERGQVIGPEGGVLEFLEGNVIVDVPAGAVDSEIRLNVIEGPYINQEFVLKSLEIRPLDVEYNSLVKLSIRYDGLLNNGEELKTSEKYVLYHFPSEKAFYLRESGQAEQMFPCFIDPIVNTLEGRITKNGVFAVGLK
jgi:hypothetical protein